MDFKPKRSQIDQRRVAYRTPKISQDGILRARLRVQTTTTKEPLPKVTPEALRQRRVRRTYISKPALIGAGILAAIAATIIGYFAIHARTTPQLVSVPQAAIDTQSTLSRTLGAPTSATSADKTLHLIIYYDGYQNEAIAQHYVGLIQAVLRETEPYKSLNNLEVVTVTSPVSQCKVEKTVKSILKCDQALIGQINSLNLEHFKLLVLSPENFVPYATVARGKNSAFYLSTYKGALTDAEIESFVGLYFLHEFGHSLGLRDEYERTRQNTNKTITEEDTGSKAYNAARPNCAPDQKTAEQWWGAYVNAGLAGFHKGCGGNPDYLYPNTSTVMSDAPIDATYGRVSEDYLRGVLDCFYGQKSEIKYPDGSSFDGATTSCEAFKKDFPNFWSE